MKDDLAALVAALGDVAVSLVVLARKARGDGPRDLRVEQRGHKARGRTLLRVDPERVAPRDRIERMN